MKVGDCVKVFLPGESPWAEVLMISDGMMKGRIDHIATDEQRAVIAGEFGHEDLPVLHHHKSGDEVWFELFDNECQEPFWVPVENMQ